MSYNTISINEGEGFIHIKLNTPKKLNALSPEMLQELLEALDYVQGKDQINALILSGEGRFFSSGVDVKSPFFMQSLTKEEEEDVYTGVNLLHWQHQLIRKIHELPQITIAELSGNAVGGGGFGVALACDIRFTSPETGFWLVPMKLGVIQDFGATWFLEKRIGASKTLEIVMSGEPVSAEEGLRLGFINQIFPKSTLNKEVTDFARKIGSYSPNAVRLMKKSIYIGTRSSLSDQLHHEAVTNGLNFLSSEFKHSSNEYLKTLKK